MKASKEEVEGFVQKLRDFHGSLGQPEQAMLETILEGAQAQDTGAYGFKIKYRNQGGDWEDLVGFLTESDDTQGFGMRGKI